MTYKIIVADDKDYVLENFRTKLSSHLDIEPTFTNDPKEVLRLVRRDPYDYATVVVDFHFEGHNMTGDKLAEELLKINPKLIVIVCTGDMRRETPISCLRAGVKDFISKGEPLEEGIEKIRRSFQMFDEVSRVVTKKMPLSEKHIQNSGWISKIGMVGWSDSLAEVAKRILTLKDNGGDTTTVLIRGESGTGKELLARAIHDSSGRAKGEFVSINCAAIPENLLESTLFGHEKGSFTGADKRKVGKFLAATGGTIFLDEIGEMKPELQAKLLRVLQEKTIEPVGLNKPIPIDVRVVAATHVDLEARIETKEFREDLYYRLNQIPINVAPLRERTEDIMPLVMHFKDKHGAGSEKKLMYKTLEYLKNYEWRGNVRELENTVKRLLIFTKGDEIKPEHLEAKIFNTSKFLSASTYPELKVVLDQMIEEKEKDFLINKIRNYESVRQAAKALAIPNTTLQRKLSEWGYANGEGL